MKKLFILMLSALLLLSSCSSSDGEKHISAVIYESLLPSDGANISDYRIISALVNCDESLDGYTYSPDLPDGRTVSHGEYLLSLAFAKRGGVDVSAYNTETSLDALAERIATPEKLSCYEIFLCVSALTMFDRDFDRENVVKSLESRQSEISGGFYDYVPEGGTVACEAEASAYAYMTYVILQDAANDFYHDNALVYLGNIIGDDNTISDVAGKSSCRTTAVVMTALLSSGIPTDGEISTALLTAVNGFKSGSGYSEYKNGSASRSIDADVLLCASCALHGNPFTKK